MKKIIVAFLFSTALLACGKSNQVKYSISDEYFNVSLSEQPQICW